MKNIYVDGGCGKNGQKDYSQRTMRFAVVDDKKAVLVDNVIAGGGSNNIAEFMAVREALTWAVNEGLPSIHIITDSRNNVHWWNKKSSFSEKINNPALVTEIKKDIEHLKTKITASISWVTRRQNYAGVYIEKNKVK